VRRFMCAMCPTTEKPEGMSSRSGGRVAVRISSYCQDILDGGMYLLSRSCSLGRRCRVVLTDYVVENMNAPSR